MVCGLSLPEPKAQVAFDVYQDPRPTSQAHRIDPPRDASPRRRRAGHWHMKAEHRMGRNYLTGRDGDRINAVLAAASYNFGLLLRWLERLLRALMRMLLTTPAPAQNA